MSTMSREDSFVKWVVETSHKESSIIGSVFGFIYAVATNEIIKYAMNLAVPIMLGVYCVTNDKLNLVKLWTGIVIYALLLIPIYKINQYKAKKYPMAGITEEVLRWSVVMSRRVHDDMYKQNVNRYNDLPCDDVFLKVSNYVVLSLFNMLEKQFSKRNYRVTILQQFEDGGQGRYCKLIAYQNDGSDVPQMRMEKKKLFSHSKNKELYVRLFEEDENLKEYYSQRNILFLRTPDEVRLHFRSERPPRTMQYIGAPIRNADNVIFLVQICSYDEKGFGTDDEMNAYIEQVLFPHIQFLEIAYEFQRLLQMKSPFYAVKIKKKIHGEEEILC